MKNIRRFLLGALSSLLFAIGFTHAADQLDPMSRSVSKTSDSAIAGAPDCGVLCDIVDGEP